MGLLKGSLSLSRYRVEGELPEGFKDFLDRRIRRNLFQEIDDSTAELSVGWVSAHDFLDTRLEFASYALDPYVVLGLRLDRRRVPSSTLKKYWRREMDQAKAYGEGRALSRPQREELKEKARLDLLRRIPPTTQMAEVCWDTSRGQVLFCATGKSARELFEEHFRKSFGLTLTPEIPYLLAQSLLPPQAHSALEQAQPLSLYQEG